MKNRGRQFVSAILLSASLLCSIGVQARSRGTVNISSSSTYQPLLVQRSSTFGTWLELINTSTGGQVWNILSAVGGNAEGAGNTGITNLHGGKILAGRHGVGQRSVDVAELQHTLLRRVRQPIPGYCK